MRVFVQHCAVLAAINDTFPLFVNFIKDVQQNFSVYLDVAVDDARPMQNHVCEVSVKFLKVYKPALAHVHKSETELVSLRRRTVAHDVHNSAELIQFEETVLVIIKALKYAVCEKRVLVLPQQTHNRSELFALHYSYFFFTFSLSSRVEHFNVLHLGMTVKITI